MVLGRRSRYKGRIHHVNPFLTEVGMFGGNPYHRRHHGRRRHHRHNPVGGGVMHSLKFASTHPLDTLGEGAMGILSAALSIGIPNWLLPITGTDIFSKLLRGLSRIAAAALVVSFNPFHRYSKAVSVGGYIGATGATVLDLLGTRVTFGAGDVGQTPMTLLSSISFPTFGTTAAYAGRPNLAAALSAYTRPMLPAARPGGGILAADFPVVGITRHKLF